MKLRCKYSKSNLEDKERKRGQGRGLKNGGGVGREACLNSFPGYLWPFNSLSQPSRGSAAFPVLRLHEISESYLCYRLWSFFLVVMNGCFQEYSPFMQLAVVGNLFSDGLLHPSYWFFILCCPGPSDLLCWFPFSVPPHLPTISYHPGHPLRRFQDDSSPHTCLAHLWSTGNRHVLL